MRGADAAPLGNGGAYKRTFAGSRKRWPVAEDRRGGVNKKEQPASGGTQYGGPKYNTDIICNMAVHRIIRSIRIVHLSPHLMRLSRLIPAPHGNRAQS